MRTHFTALDHATALSDNGFTVFRGLFSPTECAELSADLKAEAGIRDGEEFSKIDATNCFATARELLLEGRVLDAARASIGSDVRFLQVSDLQYRRDTAAWHRDSVHRSADASAAPDWNDPGTAYRVVKVIVYLETENAAMGIMAGSHRRATDMDHAAVRQLEAAGKHTLVEGGTPPNRRVAAAHQRVPLVWKAEIGDVLVFDERVFHAGRRVERGRVTTNRDAPKLTLSLVFGADNRHSERLYSYFRFARKELPYRDLPPALRAVLSERGLVLSQGWTNYYRRHPEELPLVYLRDGTELQPLIDQFRRSAQ
jgi:Phytanoyl-CoA dioxygenase (PhyH)